ncbi:SGNH/GDSL hydrolase family protein [Actinomycetospora chiangmaiensis]|uniref:SGNH/GDSL hydrolase family protein n=1 Tax=Actinomycetospora chiangmaiensis TaxID=402650 RepID=UPI000524A19E|nr:SGNH/GDSL hydrolase family protein [Actinomycetospora chiangmaiensis]
MRLTVLGDSFVEGRGDPDPDGGFRAWAPLLAESLGVRAERWRNLGAYRATTQDVVDRQLPRAVADQAPVVGVVVGTNDVVSDWSAPRFAANLDMIFGALAGPGTVVFTAGYPDMPSRLPVPERFRDLLRGRFGEANAVLAATARRHGVAVLDLARCPHWAADEVWSADGLHPNAAGHRRFAAAAAAVLSDDGWGAAALPAALPAAA